MPKSIYDHTVWLGEKRDRVRGRLNSGGTTTTPRSRLNFIEGTGIDITVSDDATNDELDITIASTSTSDDPGKYIIRGWDYVGSAASDYPTTGFSLGKVPLGAQVAAATGTSAFTNGEIRVWPFIVGRSGTCDLIEFEVVGSGGTTARSRVAIYENASRTRLYPTTLVVETGEIDTSGAPASLKATTVSAALVAGTLYWAAYATNSGTPVLRTLAAGSQFAFVDTNAAAGGAKMQIFNGFTFNKAYAAFPATFHAAGTGTAGTSAVALSGIVPLVSIHFST